MLFFVEIRGEKEYGSFDCLFSLFLSLFLLFLFFLLGTSCWSFVSSKRRGCNDLVVLGQGSLSPIGRKAAANSRIKSLLFFLRPSSILSSLNCSPSPGLIAKKRNRLFPIENQFSNQKAQYMENNKRKESLNVRDWTWEKKDGKFSRDLIVRKAGFLVSKVKSTQFDGYPIYSNVN